MHHALRASLHIVLALSIALVTPYPLKAQAQTAPVQATDDFTPTAQEAEQIKYDLNLQYFGMIKQELPQVAALAFDKQVKETPTWKITGQNSLLDSDPFFMRAQSWIPTPRNSPCDGGNDGSVCFFRDGASVTLAISGHSQALKIDQALTPVLETAEHVFLTPDDTKLFQVKTQDANEPGEGVFFVAKKDLLFANGRPVPVFFFPLPGEGWTGKDRKALDLQVTDQVVLYDASGFGLPIDGHDIALMEKAQRQNLVLAVTFAILDGQMNQATGITLPKPNTTLAYGLFLSGQTTNKIDGLAHNPGLKRKFEIAAQKVAAEIIPAAHAHDSTKDTSEKIDAQIEKRAEQLGKEDKYDWSYWKRWLINGVLWGGFGLAAYSVYSPIDFSNMITAEMPIQIATVAKIIGAVAVASVVMKYTIHRAHFKKLYPVHPDDGILRRLNQEHKGIMSELAYGLYFSMASIPQGLRHGLAFLKERFIPRNKMVYKAWDATMGYQMRQSSRLPMNFKTQYLGWVLGLADCVQVFVFLMILGPWFMNATGFQLNLGAATAAYASAEVLRNCLAYLQSGAYGYSAEVKFIALASAEASAKKELQAAGKNPNAAANRDELTHLTEKYLEIRYKTVGLPGQDEFLYDPITFIEGVAKKLGYQSEQAKAALPRSKFVLQGGNWGLVRPALQQALKTAREALAKSPSAIGAQTVRQLERAVGERSNTLAMAGRAWDVSASAWGRQGAREWGGQEVAKYWKSVHESNKALPEGEHKKPGKIRTALAFTKGVFKYISDDGTKWSRGIRETLFVMSNTAKSSEAYNQLPSIWKEKAESDEAAVLSAELFHRAFFSLYEHEDNLITPDASVESQYGRAARLAVEKESKNDSALNDPFVREVRIKELMFRLKQRDIARREVVDYKPAAIGAAEQKYWDIARQKAAEVWATEKDQSPDQRWSEMHASYRELTDPPRNEQGEFADPNFVPMDPAHFANSYRYKLLVAREFAAKVGLTANSAEESEFVRKVVVEAVSKTETHLKAPLEAAYIAKMNGADKQFYEAQVFSRHFIDSYIALSVHSDEHLKPYSPEYPGIGQRVRKWSAKIPGGTVINGVVRTFEALFRNEETSYRADWAAWFRRNVPMIPDMVKNFATNLRVMPYFLTLSYLTSWYVWQVHTPYALWALTFLIGFLNPTFVEINNRVQKNFDIKPMADVPSKLIYGWFHGMMTNPELIAVQTYAQPIVSTFDNYVVSPVKSGLSACERILTGGTGAPRSR